MFVYTSLFEWSHPRRVGGGGEQRLGLAEAVGAVRGRRAVRAHPARAVAGRRAAGPAAQPLRQGEPYEAILLIGHCSSFFLILYFYLHYS